jgi:hypothetical protein
VPRKAPGACGAKDNEVRTVNDPGKVLAHRSRASGVHPISHPCGYRCFLLRKQIDAIRNLYYRKNEDKKEMKGFWRGVLAKNGSDVALRIQRVVGCDVINMKKTTGSFLWN